jgi:hypothetical protein
MSEDKNTISEKELAEAVKQLSKTISTLKGVLPASLQSFVKGAGLDKLIGSFLSGLGSNEKGKTPDLGQFIPKLLDMFTKMSPTNKK